jgi:hypothetical protein
MKFVGSIGISVKNDGNCSLNGNSTRDRFADPFRASGNQDHFVFKFEIHLVRGSWFVV